MDKIDFSIIFNSRDRVPMLTQMLESVRKNTNCIERLEVIVNFDDDDENSLNAIDGLKKKYKFLKCLVNKREKNIHINVNKMAFMAEGRYIWALGDDCHIMTMGWDRVALSKFHQASFMYPDNIILGAVDSTSVDKVLHYGWYCDAPILTRDARDGLGYLIHPHYVSAGADVATWIIYSSVGRILDLREIIFDHVTHNSIEACNTKDKTQLEYLERMDLANFNPFTRDYSQEIEQIRNLIDAKKNPDSL